MVMREKGEHLGIYHVGTMEEVTIAELARSGSRAHAGREIELVPGQAAAGGTRGAVPTFRNWRGWAISRACRSSEGLKPTLDWYWRNAELGAENLTASDDTGRLRLASQQSRACRRHRRQRPGRMLSDLRPRAAR